VCLFDFDGLRLGFLGLREFDVQHAVLVGRGDFVRFRGRRQAHAAREFAVEALGAVDVSFGDVLLAFAFAGHREDAVLDCDGDVLLFQSGQFEGHDVFVLVLVGIEGWQPVSERLRRAIGRRLEEAVELVAQLVERRPIQFRYDCI
jgi:extradiol dioxygenase family protein